MRSKRLLNSAFGINRQHLNSIDVSPLLQRIGSSCCSFGLKQLSRNACPQELLLDRADALLTALQTSLGAVIAENRLRRIGQNANS